MLPENPYLKIDCLLTHTTVYGLDLENTNPNQYIKRLPRS